MAYQRQQDLHRQLQAGDVLVVVHDFDARSTDELTLRRGERVELVELDDGFGDGWYLGRHLGREQTGLFPGVYTTKVPSAVSNSQSASGSQRSSLPVQTLSFPAPPTTHSHHSLQPSTSSSQTSSSYPFGSNVESDKSSSTTSYGGFFPNTASRPASATQSVYSPGMQRSIGQALTGSHTGQDSPVMNETLSVIDEHMQDLGTPRNSTGIHEMSAVNNDSESEYSNADRRPSRLGGSETDDGFEKLTADQVKYWDHRETADHLRGLGVDPKHCDIFEEQEITGDVLLDMDQSFIYMKEYDFGVMGRRLKTWHKIRDFQDRVKDSQSSRQSVAPSSTQNGSTEDLTRTHNRFGSNNPTRTLSGMDKPDSSSRQSQGLSGPTNDMSRIAPLQTQTSHAQRASIPQETLGQPWRASMAAESPSRPSAANIRELSHSRRHSSIDFNQQGAYNMLIEPNGPTTPHKKQPSLDRSWTMTSAQPTTPTASVPSLRAITTASQSFEKVSEPPNTPDPSLVDIERGYFSGGEVETRKNRNFLRKRDSLGSPVHSRQSSVLEERKNSLAAKRHSRLSSVDSVRDMVPPVSSASRNYHNSNLKSRFRSASARATTNPPTNGGLSPAVTNLEEPLSSSTSPAVSASVQQAVNRNLTLSDKARRAMGIRAVSEAVTGNEKDMLIAVGAYPSPITETPTVQSPTGSSTPSAASKSFEIDNTDTSSKGTDVAGSILSPQLSGRARPKTKKETSAYTRGLLNMTPAEARKTCDYSGWMKKKSSSLMTTWKPRLFILRGRRLSYYYSEDDKSERGIIDISGHRVLVANSDAIITLHAQLTGATSSAVPGYPSQINAAKSMDSSLSSPRPKSESSAGSVFYFKLVPPKAGISRAVQFTKPTIHYFQVDSLVQGRKWMGEMMKATIEHDLTSFETTNKQKTISLAKARARKERPPALKEGPEEGEEKENQNVEPVVSDGGLKIQGLDFEKSGNEGNSMGLLDEKTKGFDATKVFTSDTGQNPQD